MLRKRDKQIIEAVVDAKSGITGKMLAERCGVTDRTIRNDVKSLNTELRQYGVEIHAHQTRGYYVDPADYPKLASLVSTSFSPAEKAAAPAAAGVPNTPFERLLMISFLLTYSAEFITIDNIANICYLSRTAVRNDIKDLQLRVGSIPGLTLEISPLRGVMLKGPESSKRILLSKMIYHNIDDSFPFIKAMLQMFTETGEDFYRLYDAYMGYFDANNILFTDTSLISFTVETLIWADRYRKNMRLERYYSYQNKDDIALPYAELEAMFGVRLDQQEKDYLLDSLSYKRFISGDNLLSQDDNVESVVHEFCETILTNYGIDLSNYLDARSTLVTHINSLIHRIHHGFANNQQFIKDIKTMYPFPFELAASIVPIIEKHCHLKIDESELSYIAIHLSMILDDTRPQIDAAIVCTNGKTEGELIEHNIRQRFDHINFVGVFPIYQIGMLTKHYPSVRLILSTVPFDPPSAQVTVLRVSPVPSPAEVYNLSNYLATCGSDQDAAGDIDGMFRKDFFWICQQADRYEILDQMIEKLHQEHYIEDPVAFYQSIRRREAIFPTIYGNIWLPHALDYFTEKTVFGVAVNKGDVSPNLIVLIAVSRQDTIKIKGIFEKITKILSEETFRTSLVDADSYEQFLYRFKAI
jgi:lichenan operon transcriptional antiterminator